MVYFARQDKMLTPLTGEMIKNVRILVVGVGAGGNEPVYPPLGNPDGGN